MEHPSPRPTTVGVRGWVIDIFTFAKAELVWFVSRSVCLSVCRITAKVIGRFHWNLVLWLVYQLEEHLLTFGGDPVSSIPDHFFTSLTIAEYGILGDLLAFFIVTGWFPYFHDTRRNDDADKVMKSQHFESGLVDIRIRIQINPEIWIRILNHFWLRLDKKTWRRFVLVTV